MEIDKRICKVCKELKFRIRDGMYPNKKDARFVDELGAHWNGNTCPKCHGQQTKSHLKKKRDKEAIQTDVLKEIDELALSKKEEVS
jgi:hypothetical protein